MVLAMLTAWDPVRLLDRMVDDVMNGSYGTATSAKSFVPQVDVRSNDERVVFYFDVPGVRKEDIEITLERGVLTVKGARQFEAGAAKEQLLLGRSYGSFNRSFSLPDHLDEEKLAAKLVDGVLAIEIPRLKKAKPRRIEINGDGSARTLSQADEKK
jgi:HSP20 family protein